MTYMTLFKLRSSNVPLNCLDVALSSGVKPCNEGNTTANNYKICAACNTCLDRGGPTEFNRLVSGHRPGRLVDLEILADLKIMVGRLQNVDRQPKLPKIPSNIGKFFKLEQGSL